jgi:hypothetical protein
VRGAGIPRQDAPPSVVRTTEVHGGSLQGAVPSTQPSRSLTKVTLTAANPAGTGPPAGPDRAAGDGAEEELPAVVEEGDDGVDVVDAVLRGDERTCGADGAVRPPEDDEHPATRASAINPNPYVRPRIVFLFPIGTRPSLGRLP